ncbi:MAG: hypothetical protein ACRCVG_07870 [Methanobacteriaceae archaeon]
MIKNIKEYRKISAQKIFEENLDKKEKMEKEIEEFRKANPELVKELYAKRYEGSQLFK